MMGNLGISVMMALAPATMLLSAQWPAYKPLTAGCAQALVAGTFLHERFETGAWGNDISGVIPFQWSIPGKGVFTYFSAAEHKFFDGRAWHLHEVQCGKLVFCKYDWSPNVDIWFTPEQLFEIEYFDGQKTLAFHNERYTGIDVTNRGERISLVSERWLALSVATNGTPSKVLISDDGASALFRDKGMKSIRCTVPHLYRGANAEVLNEVSREQRRLRKADANTEVWMLSEAQKENIAKRHWLYLRDRKPSVVATNIFIVACDANIDGIVDAYVSSDAECDLHGNCKWSLYVGDGRGFSFADKPYKFVFDRVEEVVIDPVVHVSKDAFFKFDRIGLPSYVMPVTTVGELWDYLRQDSPVKSFRSKPGLQNAEFYSCIDNGITGITTGVASLKDIFLMNSMLISARRLPCEILIVSNTGTIKE